MLLIDFCRAHGILIDREPPLGVWRRFPTEDKMGKRNGAVKFMGDHAFVQNHATDTEVSVWKAEGDQKVDHDRIRRIAKQAQQETVDRQKGAAKKAAYLLHQCQAGHHAYLKSKGFDNERGNVMKHENQEFLLIPMRIGSHLVGCQVIDPGGGKKFLFGQRTSEAAFVFDNKGPAILCEGYATGLSVREAMKALKRRYTIYVCFSAGNMKKVALTLPGGFVVADNDLSRTGELTAKEIGWPYWMPQEVGMDANDAHTKDGLFRFSQSLGKILRY